MGRQGRRTNWKKLKFQLNQVAGYTSDESFIATNLKLLYPSISKEESF